jgi:hypothetical protein
VSFVRFLSSSLFCFLALALAAHAQVVVVVSDQVGTARYQLKGDWKDLGLLTSLSDGALIDVSKGAKSSLSFVKGGRVVHLQGPCQVRLTTDGVNRIKGDSQIDVRDVARLEGSSIPRSVNFDQMGGLVRVDEKTAPHVTSDSVTRTPEHVLTWSFSGEPEGFGVVVLDAETEEEVFLDSVGPDKRTAQLTGLEPGVEYTVLLATRTANDAYETEHPLMVLSNEDLATVQKWEERAESDGFSARVSLLSLYLEKQLWNDALALSRELRKDRPDDPNLLQLEELLSK